MTSLTRGLGGIAAGALFLMMAVTLVDVVGRYAFAQPVPGAFEVTEMLLLAVIFAALPVVSARQQHITVELVTGRLGPRGRSALHVGQAAVSAAILAVLAWRLWLKAGQLAAFGDVTTFLKAPLAPLAYAASALCALSALAVLASIRNRRDDADRDQ